MLKTFVKTRKRYPINYYELNTNLKLKESMFMLFLQDAATVNAEDNGFGYTWCEANNYGWFLLKYRIELEHYPQKYDYIEIETESRGASKLFAFRDFTIYNPENEIIGRVASCWALIDMNTKSMIAPIKAKDDFQIFEKREDDLVYNKIRTPEEFGYEKTFEVRFDELDVNHHANNSNYISWALETLPYDFRHKYSLKNLDIQIKKDISLGETVISKVSVDNLHTIHSVVNQSTGDELALLSIDWE